MGKRTDISSILVVGSGPIVIGQACELYYSGSQACRVLRDEGYRVILANSNPATIMTDPNLADRTYIEPLDPDVLAAIIARERPDALLPTMGGQTALNLAMVLSERGVLEHYGVELIGAKAEAIHTAENRDKFKQAMMEIGLEVPESSFVRAPVRSGLDGVDRPDIAAGLELALAVAEEVGYPIIVRPSFILGGAGTGIAKDAAELAHLARAGLVASPVSEILIERSIAGWKEFELEVMRDRVDNCVVVCSIENFDPMGVHTGDSVTVAPAQTLSDVEYQVMRDAAFACIRRVGVETGGSNIQFAVNPASGDMRVIEMNPRVSRSSALASKATGFPIAKIAARLAVGYTLDEIANDITRATPASFEPAIDYVVTKIPRWAFEKLPGAPDRLGTRMQSVGEVMAIGRTFEESLQKALRGLELGRAGLNCDPAEAKLDALSTPELVEASGVPTPDRPFQLEAALRRGVTVEELAEATGIDPWFLDRLAAIVTCREHLSSMAGLEAVSRQQWRRAKRLGFADAQVAYLFGVSEADARRARLAAGVRPTFKTVDTCAAEFGADTPYHYATYEDEDEVRPASRPRVVILGSGPNRIGQGIEFDYCCVHASMSLRAAGYETVMVNCNPETVSTDYDTSDRLYFEPLTEESVLDIVEAEEAAGAGGVRGVIVALGGQTPLKLAGRLPDRLIVGTRPASIDEAEDRERWSALCARLEIPQPAGGTARTLGEALAIVSRIGYPALVRPSYVLGGRAMEIVYDDAGLESAFTSLALGPEGALASERPILVDRFLEDAIEVDVDAIRDCTGDVLVAAVIEHVEEAGVHSGDSACVIPPPTLPELTIETIERHTTDIAHALGVVGPINVQYAVKQGQVFVIEANPRASRTLPFVAKATGVEVAKVAARVLLGSTLAELSAEGLLPPSRPVGAGRLVPAYVSVKEAVFPFDRFPDVDSLLGPEMRSTGEVMGVDRTFGLAFAKSQIAAGNRLPADGLVFMSLADRDKQAGENVARSFVELGFNIAATSGTGAHLRANGIEVAVDVSKLGGEPSGDAGPATGTGPVTGAGPMWPGSQASDGMPDAVDLIERGLIQLVVNTPRGRGPRADGAYIRQAASANGIPCVTTLAAARAAAAGIGDWAFHSLQVRSLQEHHADAAKLVGVASPGQPSPPSGPPPPTPTPAPPPSGPPTPAPPGEGPAIVEPPP
ncbi:MAG: carbamoyl-phosphate synthase large subunit [Acidimicrobiales bacterium]